MLAKKIKNKNRIFLFSKKFFLEIRYINITIRRNNTEYILALLEKIKIQLLRLRRKINIMELNLLEPRFFSDKYIKNSPHITEIKDKNLPANSLNPKIKIKIDNK
jgi:hypothetical protein